MSHPDDAALKIAQKRCAMRIVAELPQVPESALAILDYARDLIRWHIWTSAEPGTTIH